MFQYLCMIKKRQSISLKCEMIELLAILNILYVYNQCFVFPSPRGLIAVAFGGLRPACMWILPSNVSQRFQKELC